MRVNFSDVKTTDFEAFDAGTYAAKVTDGEIKESGPNSKNPGSEYINWELTLQDEGPLQGRKVWYMTSLLPHALFGLKGLCAATGRYTEEELEAEDFDFEIDDLIGLDVLVHVIKEKYNGEDVNRVKKVKKVGSAPSAPTSVLP